MRVVKEAARFEYIRLSDPAGEADDGGDVIKGLSAAQKTLPCRYFYDDRGSALFEKICELDEYYPSRTERGILERAAPEIARLTGPSELVELGSGNAQKTRLLLDAHAGRSHPLRFLPIDVSEGMLKASARELLSLYEDLHIQGFSGTYEQAFAALGPRASASRMLMFLGGTIGNFDARERDVFLESATSAMAPGEYFLIGADLHKDKDILEAAYNDSQGVTAEFNLNMLRHLNRRFGANFVLDRFAHHAFYTIDLHWLETLLLSLGDQRLVFKHLGFEVTFKAEETIRTEISGKFDLAELAAEFAAKGWEKVADWTDDRGWFAVTLFRLRPDCSVKGR